MLKINEWTLCLLSVVCVQSIGQCRVRVAAIFSMFLLWAVSIANWSCSDRSCDQKEVQLHEPCGRNFVCSLYIVITVATRLVCFRCMFLVTLWVTLCNTHVLHLVCHRYMCLAAADRSTWTHNSASKKNTVCRGRAIKPQLFSKNYNSSRTCVKLWASFSARTYSSKAC